MKTSFGPLTLQILIGATMPERFDRRRHPNSVHAAEALLGGPGDCLIPMRLTIPHTAAIPQPAGPKSAGKKHDDAQPSMRKEPFCLFQPMKFLRSKLEGLIALREEGATRAGHVASTGM